MTPQQWLDLQFKESYAEKYLKLVVFPTPPVPVRDFMFMPDSFKSKTFDDGAEDRFDKSDEFKPVAMLPTHWGPAVLARIKLRYLIGVSDGFLSVHHATCCASVTFAVLCEGDGVSYADKTTLNGLMLVGRSCHPGSHFVVPDAPYLTSMFHYALAPTVKEKYMVRPVGNGVLERFTYMCPDEAMLLFPEYDFSSNLEIDMFLSKCIISPSVAYHKINSGMGDWAKPYIRKIRRNIIDIAEAKDHEWRQRPYAVFSDESQKDDGTQAHTAISGRAAGEVHCQGDGDHAEGVGDLAGGGSGPQDQATGGRQADGRSKVIWTP